MKLRQSLEGGSHKPRSARSPQELEDTRKDPPLEPLDGAQPCLPTRCFGTCGPQSCIGEVSDALVP